MARLVPGLFSFLRMGEIAAVRRGRCMAGHPARARGDDVRITTTDILKCVGVAAFLIDHTGVFFDPAEPWWRLLGRVAAPIFFFLVGFARTRRVPWTWFILGTALTITVGAWFGWPILNILLNFALLRGVVLPAVERHVMPQPWRMALLALLCMVAVDATDVILEYGTEGWLWAFAGQAQRRALESGDPFRTRMRDALLAAASVTYIVREVHDYAFDGWQTAILVGLVILLALRFAQFRRSDSGIPAPQPIPAIVRFCGRASLEIYALTLFGMQILAYGIGMQ
jgi:uncharacterized membrane protein